MFSTNLNKGLYGPTRISAQTEIKDVLLLDHVLQNGEWHGDNQQKNPWKTSFSISFEKPSVSKNIKHVKVNVQDFSPKYMSDKIFGKSGSVYGRMFAKGSQGPSFSARNS